jgi:ElaB/YqjD/DUF883 family membrane-anchored ribosome-binding protein
MTYSNDPLLSGGARPVPYPAGAPIGSDRGIGAQPQQPSTADVAKDQAADVAGTARDAGKHVAGVAGEQAGQVASEASHQVKRLVEQTRGELTEQAAAQQQRVASGLRSLSEELSSMARGSEQSGMASDLVHQASQRTNAVASWLEQREPGHVVDEVTRFARQRPGAFLALAAGAGLLVGRLGRGLKAANDEGNGAAGSQGPAAGSRGQIADNGGPGYPPAPLPPVPAYPPSGYGSGGYDPTPGYPASTPSPNYPPPAPSYPPPAPSYPQSPAPGYQAPQAYPQQQAPGHLQRSSGQDLNP